MNALARAAVPLLAALALFAPLPALALAAPAAYVVDGIGDDWTAEDVVGVSTHPPADPNATVDLTSLSAADNTTHWFFRLSFAWVGPVQNATLALYLFGPDDASPSARDPFGAALWLPSGAPLTLALSIEASPSFPAGSKAAFFDGVTWKNRTFVELGITAALNVTGAFVELALPRDAVPFVHAGSAACALLVSAGSIAGNPLTAADSVPDDPVAPEGTLASRAAFYDYAFNPPIVFSALGLSDPFAVAGDTVQVFVELTNEGPKNATGVSGQVLVDGIVLGSRDGLRLLSHNGTAVVSVPWSVTAGPHNVTARSFPGGATRSIRLTVPGALAELSIVDASARPSNPSVGDAFAVDVRVRNDGNSASPALHLLLKEGTLVLSTSVLPSISPGNSTLVSLPARAPRPGALLLRVEIDGVNSANATAQVPVTVSSVQPPFGVPALAWLVIGTAGCAAAAWLVTPRLARRGRPPHE